VVSLHESKIELNTKNVGRPGCNATPGLFDARSKIDKIHLLTAIGLTPGGSSTVHIYTQTIHRTTKSIWEEFGPCPVFASYSLAFALQLRQNPRKKLSHGSRRVPVGTMETEYTEKGIRIIETAGDQ
jgi:hypothetical protein